MKAGDFGVTIYYGHRPVRRKCADCPFKREAEGQPYLTEERMEGIKFAATMGQPFHCHKTVYQKGVEWEQDPETGDERPPRYDRRYQVCAGATEFAEALAVQLGVEPRRIGTPPAPEGKTHREHDERQKARRDRVVFEARGQEQQAEQDHDREQRPTANPQRV